MKDKPILCPQRLRFVPRQFSWIDQRLVRHGHITRCTPAASALYLLLATVADAQGLSYYSDATAARLLSMSAKQLREARSHLLSVGLIAYQNPYYQVLSLEPQPAGGLVQPVAGSGGPSPEQPQRSQQALSVGEILRQIIDQPGSQDHD